MVWKQLIIDQTIMIDLQSWGCIITRLWVWWSMGMIRPQFGGHSLQRQIYHNWTLLTSTHLNWTQTELYKLKSTHWALTKLYKLSSTNWTLQAELTLFHVWFGHKTLTGFYCCTMNIKVSYDSDWYWCVCPCNCSFRLQSVIPPVKIFCQVSFVWPSFKIPLEKWDISNQIKDRNCAF